MDDYINTLFLFEELADKLDISIRYETMDDELMGPGGLCRIQGKFILVINSKATTNEKIRIMIEALRKFDLDDIYVKPALRELLEEDETSLS